MRRGRVRLATIGVWVGVALGLVLTESALSGASPDPQSDRSRSQRPGDNQPPAVWVTSPAATSYPAGATIQFSASASDVDGSIVKIELYVNNGLWAVESSNSSTVWLNNVATGVYTLTAVA